MTTKPDFFEDFYAEAMTEMARNFFSRRKEAEARLEGFTALAGQVRAVADKVRRRLAAFVALTCDEPLAMGFLARAGGEYSALGSSAGSWPPPWPIDPPFAFTFSGRHQKTLEKAYALLHQAVRDYREGAYGPDPRDPRRKILLPNYRSLRELAERINDEVRSVNTAQTPTTVLAYAKSLDPQAAGRESVTGGLVGLDVGKIDRDLAFTLIDFGKLGLPDYPELRPADDVADELDALGRAVRAGHPRPLLEQAMASLSLRRI